MGLNDSTLQRLETADSNSVMELTDWVAIDKLRFSMKNFNALEGTLPSSTKEWTSEFTADVIDYYGHKEQPTVTYQKASTGTGTQVTSTTSQGFTKTMTVKLADYPTFSGKTDDWFTYKQQFEATARIAGLGDTMNIVNETAHVNKRNSDPVYDRDVRKLYDILQMKNAKGGAITKIETFANTQDGTLAWNALKEYYDLDGNKYLYASKCIHKILKNELHYNTVGGMDTYIKNFEHEVNQLDKAGTTLDDLLKKIFFLNGIKDVEFAPTKDLCANKTLAETIFRMRNKSQEIRMSNSLRRGTGRNSVRKYNQKQTTKRTSFHASMQDKSSTGDTMRLNDKAWQYMTSDQRKHWNQSRAKSGKEDNKKNVQRQYSTGKEHRKSNLKIASPNESNDKPSKEKTGQDEVQIVDPPQAKKKTKSPSTYSAGNLWKDAPRKLNVKTTKTMVDLTKLPHVTEETAKLVSPTGTTVAYSLKPSTKAIRTSDTITPSKINWANSGKSSSTRSVHKKGRNAPTKIPGFRGNVHKGRVKVTHRYNDKNKLMIAVSVRIPGIKEGESIRKDKFFPFVMLRVINRHNHIDIIVKRAIQRHCIKYDLMTDSQLSWFNRELMGYVRACDKEKSRAESTYPGSNQATVAYTEPVPEFPKPAIIDVEDEVVELNYDIPKKPKELKRTGHYKNGPIKKKKTGDTSAQMLTDSNDDLVLYDELHGSSSTKSSYRHHSTNNKRGNYRKRHNDTTHRRRNNNASRGYSSNTYGRTNHYRKNKNFRKNPHNKSYQDHKSKPSYGIRVL